MKTLTKELWMEVPKRRAIVSIHDEVDRAVAESGVREGLVLVKDKRRWSYRLSSPSNHQWQRCHEV
jgi:hypothetical protein